MRAIVQFIKWVWRRAVLSNFFAGLFIVLPLAISIAIVGWLADKLKGLLGPDTYFSEALQIIGGRFVNHESLSLVIGWAVVLGGLWLLGLFAKAFARHELDEGIHALFIRIPLFNAIYKPVSQVINLLKQDGNKEVKRMQVVYCSFGLENCVNFLALQASSELYTIGGKTCLLIYIPTSPVPMSGGLIFVPKEAVQPVDMPVDSMMQIYFSLGALAPQVMPAQLKIPAVAAVPAQ